MSGNNRNRSAGTLGDYMLMMKQGYPLKSIGLRYGIQAPSVHNALKRHGLPTCARNLHKSPATIGVDEWLATLPPSESYREWR